MRNSREYMRDYQNKKRKYLDIAFNGKLFKITVLQLEILNSILKICEIFNVKNFTELVKNFTENVKNFTISDVKNFTQDDVKNFTGCKELYTTSQSLPTTNGADNSRVSSGFGVSGNGENSIHVAPVGGERGGIVQKNTICTNGTFSGNSTIYLKEKNIKKRKGNRENHNEDYSADFLQFYDFYPRKKGKEQACKIWRKTSRVRPALQSLIAAVSLEMRTEQWQKENGDFIPYPSTWLNKRLWLDYSEQQIAAEIARMAAIKAKPVQPVQTYAAPQQKPRNENIAQMLAEAGITREVWDREIEKEDKRGAFEMAVKAKLSPMEINTHFREGT